MFKVVGAVVDGFWSGVFDALKVVGFAVVVLPMTALYSLWCVGYVLWLGPKRLREHNKALDLISARAADKRFLELSRTADDVADLP